MNKQQLLADIKRQISITDIAIFRLRNLDTSSLPVTTQKALINLTDYIVKKQINIKELLPKLYVKNKDSLVLDLDHQTTGIALATSRLESINQDIEDKNINKQLKSIIKNLSSAQNQIKNIAFMLLPENSTTIGK